MKPLELDNKNLGKYSVAPYNFVSLPKFTISRYKNVHELPAHKSFKNIDGDDLLSGYIEYTLKAETPIIVCKGEDEGTNKKFFRNASGNYAIPGSTIRGMVRTNSQILSFSNIIGEKDENGKFQSSEIENSRFLYRDIASNNVLTKQYKRVLGIKGRDGIARNLKVGYIKREGNRYYIYPSIDMKMENPYFKISEIRLRKIAKNVKGIKYMYNENLIKKENEIKKLNKFKKRSERDRLVNKYRNDNFKPYQIEITFDYDDKKRITRIGELGEYNNKGYLLTSNHINGKMSHYVIPEEDKNIPKLEVPENSIEAYIDDLIATKKADNYNGDIVVKPEYIFYGLPEEKEKKPIFYIVLGDKLHFGFTPYLRIMYEKSILDGIPEHYNDTNGISYTESIFGFINKTIESSSGRDRYSYKSRVSFEDAEAVGNAIIDSESIIEMLLAEPKPTSFNLYLEQDLRHDAKNLEIYEDDFTIRGFKQYWLKDYVEDPDVKKGNMTSKIFPLKEGTIFNGRIYFNNLEDDELGLLLWALRLNDNSYQNIGLAKPYGFGRVKVEELQLYIEDIDKKYSSFCFDYMLKEDENRFIDIFKERFSKEYLNGNEIDTQKPIKELLEIKSRIVKREDANYYRYMDLNEFKEMKVLPDILSYDKVVRTLGKTHKNKEQNFKKYRNNKNIRAKVNNRKQSNNKKRKTFGVSIDLSDWDKKNK
ncbi:TIGR03986 family CRISPR-associated RAMP protein [Schnuerera sp. xch1]|uniref:TIGR03986 family type III CRISPR-associated RAMP protein n=1 Tax=Schnuerera sp. xch1 TaxID=2874283 RepID=UPI001CC074F2|nr:TIGR03986 family CRISPR-associated RAMP protein [Schnuerera sp. xch1]MBZ2175782.1 TIGR03986 family CRISPR-associated RAMP protein [Schnuerera sp. xch1]